MSKVDVSITKVGTCKGDKRQGAPFILKWKCPNCGIRNEDDYADGGGYYFSYPTIPGIQEVELYCGECGEEFGEVKLMLNMTLELVKEG